MAGCLLLTGCFGGGGGAGERGADCEWGVEVGQAFGGVDALTVEV